MKIDKKLIMPIIITAVVVAGISFYGGMKYGQQSAVATRQQALQQSRGQRAGGVQSGGFVTGEVISKDADSITVKMRDGSSRIVLYSVSTSVTKPVSSSVQNISVGTQVMVGGTQNSDGSITAQSIQVREGQMPGQIPRQGQAQ